MSKGVSVKLEPGLKPQRAFVDGRPAKNVMHSNESVLILNEANAYKFVPIDIAEDLARKHKAIILTAHDKDYAAGVKLALGRPDGFRPGEAIIMEKNPVTPSQIGKFDVDGMIAGIDAQVEEASKNPLPEAASSDPSSFAAKLREKRFDA